MSAAGNTLLYLFYSNAVPTYCRRSCQSSNTTLLLRWHSICLPQIDTLNKGWAHISSHRRSALAHTGKLRCTCIGLSKDKTWDEIVIPVLVSPFNIEFCLVHDQGTTRTAGVVMLTHVPIVNHQLLDTAFVVRKNIFRLKQASPAMIYLVSR